MDGSVREVVRRALAEDRAHEDITTLATVHKGARGTARLVARQACILAGLDVFTAAFLELDATIEVEPHTKDGAPVADGEVIATVRGALRPILSAERTALNLVQRLSGTATLTHAFVDAAGGVAIRDTRKTTPGLRALEKAAVLAGGGTNHRFDLAAAVLIKDNHIAAAGGIREAIEAAKRTGRWVEVEADTLEQVRAAVDAGADEILLDNMTMDQLKAAVAAVGGRARTEASGGVTLQTVADIAATGVDAISVGALTHSAPAIDLSLEVEAN